MYLKSIVALVIILLFGCNNEPKEQKSKIEGTWKLVYNSIEENDSLMIKELGNRDFIKIINQSHFAFLNQIPDTSQNYYAGAGTYTLKGDQYTETLQYLKNKKWRGQVFEFTVTFKGDTLIQQGVEEVPEAGVNRYIVEKYIRLD